MTDDAPAAPKLVFERWHELPEDHAREAARMMEFHMMSELIGPVQEFRWVPHAPILDAKLIFAAKSQDGVGHGLMLMRVCQDLTGKSSLCRRLAHCETCGENVELMRSQSRRHVVPAGSSLLSVLPRPQKS